MKKIVFSLYILSLLTTAQAQGLDRSIRPKPGPAPEIKLGDAQSFTLANGLKVFVVENHKLPAVTYSILLDIHPQTDASKSGLTGMVGELITSGTQSRSKDKFDEEVDFIAADLGASSQSVYGRSLTKYQDKLLGLMSDAVLNANFRQEDLDKLKKQALANLEAGKNEPAAMLNNVASVLNYGAAHPYGEVTTEQTIANITLADCNAYYRKYFRPNVAYMAIVGDITPAKAREMAEQYFGKWEKADVPRAKYPAATAPAATQVDFVPRDGAVQSVVSITYPVDLMIGTPDVIRTRVLNQVLGGSFQRLDRNLRETHAWTYGSNSSISADDIVGNVDVNVKCRNEVTDSSITEMLSEMNRLRNEPLTAEELQGAVNFLSGVFALGLENPQTIAQYAINIDRYNMPKDYYKNYLKSLSAVSVQDVQATAQKYLKTSNAHIVVVGNKTEVNKLKKFSANGELHYFDNYGNPIQPVESKVINGVGVEQVLSKYIDAIGGKAAIEGLKDLSLTMDVTQGVQSYTVNQTVLSPEKLRMSVVAEGRVVQRMVINGDKSYSEAQGQKQPLPAEAIKEYMAQADLQSLLHPAKYGISYTLIGSEDLDGKPVYTVEKVENDGRKRTIQSYDAASGLLVKEVVSSKQPDGQSGVEIRNISDYREVKNGNGYKMAFTKTAVIGQSVKIQSAKANSNVKEGDFR